MSKLPDSIKYKMMLDAGYHFNDIELRYIKLVDFAKCIRDSFSLCENDNDCVQMLSRYEDEAEALLKSMGEL